MEIRYVRNRQRGCNSISAVEKIIHMEKTFVFYHYTEINLKVKYIKLLEESIVEYVYNYIKGEYMYALDIYVSSSMYNPYERVLKQHKNTVLEEKIDYIKNIHSLQNTIKIQNSWHRVREVICNIYNQQRLNIQNTFMAFLKQI